MADLRQFRITDRSGLRTYVMSAYEPANGGTSHRSAAVAAGFSHDDYHWHRVRVELVRAGFERPLPFGDCPLIVRTAA